MEKVTNTNRWEYLLDSDILDAALVKQAIENTWGIKAAVNFTGWCRCNGESNGIRIKISRNHYEVPHLIALGSDLRGLRNGMVLNFNWANFYAKTGREMHVKAVATPEFGHALSLVHEHKRPDYSYDEQKSQCIDPEFALTPCDVKSVMNYCNPIWNNNGVLIDYDIMGIQQLNDAPLHGCSITYYNLDLTAP